MMHWNVQMYWQLLYTMRDIQRGGDLRTVFVTHNVRTINSHPSTHISNGKSNNYKPYRREHNKESIALYIRKSFILHQKSMAFSDHLTLQKKWLWQDQAFGYPRCAIFSMRFHMIYQQLNFFLKFIRGVGINPSHNLQFFFHLIQQKKLEWE